MNTRIRKLGATLLVALVPTSVVPETTYAGGRPSPRPQQARPHVSAPHVQSQQYRPPHFNNNNYVRPMMPAPMTRRNIPNQTVNRAATPRPINRAGVAGTASGIRPTMQRGVNGSNSSRNYANSSRSRQNYGNGSSNRYRSGYSSNNRNLSRIVSQLRSTHSSLSRLDQDYQGHRVRALSAIHSAVRQLSSSGSSRSSNSAMSSNMNFRRGNGSNANGVGNRSNLAQNQRMPQAQSDARMRQAFQRLQSVNNSLSNQGNRQVRAQRSVQMAMRELSTALTIR